MGWEEIGWAALPASGGGWTAPEASMTAGPPRTSWETTGGQLDCPLKFPLEDGWTASISQELDPWGVLLWPGAQIELREIQQMLGFIYPNLAGPPSHVQNILATSAGSHRRIWRAIGALWRIQYAVESSGLFWRIRRFSYRRLMAQSIYIGALWRIGRFNGGYGGFGPLVSGFRHGKFV